MNILSNINYNKMAKNKCKAPQYKPIVGSSLGIVGSGLASIGSSLSEGRLAHRLIGRLINPRMVAVRRGEAVGWGGVLAVALDHCLGIAGVVGAVAVRGR